MREKEVEERGIGEEEDEEKGERERIQIGKDKLDCPCLQMT